MRLFGFAGWSGSGKTTLIERLIPQLIARGNTVSLIKHAHHDFDIDQPGKDSWRHRRAGCREVLITSDVRWALMHELRDSAELTLSDAIAQIAPCDVLLVEGFKSAPIPKLEVWRADNGKALLHPGDPNIVAIATDRPGQIQATVPVYALDDVDAIATLVQDRATGGTPER